MIRSVRATAWQAVHWFLVDNRHISFVGHCRTTPRNASCGFPTGRQKRQEKMADIKSRMETVRALYRENPYELRPEASRALAEAEKYFGVDLTRRKDLPPSVLESARYYDAVVLARLMAEVLFGRPGRGRQTKDWSEGKLYNLGQVYFYVKKRSRPLRTGRWTVLSTSYFQRDGGPRTPAIDLA
jgi:hypothetical protein